MFRITTSRDPDSKRRKLHAVRDREGFPAAVFDSLADARHFREDREKEIRQERRKRARHKRAMQDALMR